MKHLSTVVPMHLVVDPIIVFKNKHNIHGSRLLSLYKIRKRRNP